MINTAQKSAIDLSDRLTETLPVIAAILDVAKVLTALENAPSHCPQGGMVTGEGYADGQTLVDASLPDLLAFGTKLIRQTRADISSLYAITREALATGARQ